MSECADYVPPSDRAIDDLRSELVPIVGPDCAAAIIVRAEFFMALGCWPSRPEIAAAFLRLRPASILRRDVQQVAKLARRLGQLLAHKDTQQAIAWELRRPQAETLGSARRVGRIDRMGLDMATLSEAAEKAAVSLDRPTLNDPRDAFLLHLARVLGEYGNPVATGEQSRMVRIARIVWPLLPFAGDPRDRWRALVKSQGIDLRRYAHMGAADPIRSELELLRAAFAEIAAPAAHEPE